jgi:dihydrofolate synthase / folylpolyglutamate synthase
MTYAETLEYLYTQLPMFSRVGAPALKPNLDNTIALCTALGNPEIKFPCVHIGGTNGKGSTSHLVAAALQAAGYKVGLYISPHYKDFRERVKIDGEYISKAYVRQFVAQNKALFETIEPSFFEMTVALAFSYFAAEKIDIAVVEVGLGGRLDSTNIIQPLVSVITNISFDHTDLLGNSLPEIAFEKAGIIKKNTPVVIGEQQPETTPVFLATANALQAPLSFASQTIEIQAIESAQTNFDRIYLNVKGSFWGDLKNLELNLSGGYQEKNTATALQALSVLVQNSDFKVSEAALRTGFSELKTRTKLIGRWHVLQEQPLVVCDSAHNEAGLKVAMQMLEKLPRNKLHFVLGMVRDKDISKMLALLPKNARYYFVKANIPRALDAQILQVQAQVQGLNGKAYTSVRRALAAAKHAAETNDIIYVGGSIFVVAEVL